MEIFRDLGLQCLFFFSFRGREYAFKDSEQVRSRTSRQRAVRLGTPDPDVWVGTSLVVCGQLKSCRQCPSKGWMCPAFSILSGQRIPQLGFIQPYLCRQGKALGSWEMLLWVKLVEFQSRLHLIPTVCYECPGGSEPGWRLTPANVWNEAAFPWRSLGKWKWWFFCCS